MTTRRYCLDDVSDRDLLDALLRLNRQSRAVLAEILCHLAEVDRRKLYLEQGCASLFAYAVEVLGCSEDEAAKRIHASRAARAYPVIFEMVERGELHLTAVNVLAPHLRAENHGELLAAARHASKAKLEELIAAHAPKPDAVTRLCRLPAPRAASLPLSPAGLGAVAPSPSADTATLTAPPPSEPSTPSSLASPPVPASRPSLKPLSPQRYRLQVTLGAEGHAALLRARELMRHRVPSGDLALVIEKAVIAFADALEQKKLGKRNKGLAAAAEHDSGETTTEAEHTPQAPAPTGPQGQSMPAEHAPEHVASDAPPAATAVQQPRGDAGAKAKAKRTRYIPRAVRRAVAERDEHRCTYTSAEGHRCSQRGALEFHHIEPYARGGESTVARLTLRCAAHNRHQAVLDFGAEHIQRRISERRQAP
jgi:5-methylcytosine-specific restriction endonuclease McrA